MLFCGCSFLNEPKKKSVRVSYMVIGWTLRGTDERGRWRRSSGSGCRITDVSAGPLQIDPVPKSERNWLPVAVATAIVVVAAAVLFVILEHGKATRQVTPISAQPDPYASSLPITQVEMSQSANLAGGKVTYLDGHIANTGSRTVTSVTVQVLFRDVFHDVTQNETQPLMLIRTRDPYVDIEPVSAAPLKPGDERDFRLIFDTLADTWNGAYPEVRIVRVVSK